MNQDRINEFEEFLNREVTLASEELERIDESSRKHLQKLVYTNLVDRFDSMVDHVLIDNALHDELLSESLAKLTDTLPEGEILRLVADPAKAASHVESRVKETMRSGILRNRHSRKLNRLLEVFCPNEELSRPRVNVSTGKVMNTFKPQNGKIPSSIPGYADWLYSRRNAVVHGGGKGTMLQNDIEQLKKLYRCTVGKSVKLKLASIKNASEFYRSITGMLKKT